MNIPDEFDEAMEELAEQQAATAQATKTVADHAGITPDLAAAAASLPDAAVADIMSDPAKLAALMSAMKEQEKADKKAKRQAAEDARRERRGLPRKGEATQQQKEALEEIMDKADPELVLTFLMLHKPATLIQCIQQMEKAEFPWHQEV